MEQFFLKNIELVHFRKFEEALFDLNPRMNVFIGKNASGGKVKVTGTADTDVVFTDIESGETYVIGYITSRVGDTIKLERGKWYRVEGIGELTVSPVNVRIE